MSGGSYVKFVCAFSINKEGLHSGSFYATTNYTLDLTKSANLHSF